MAKTKETKATKKKLNFEMKSRRRPDGQRRKKPVESFKTYLYKVLRSAHPDIRISTRAMDIMNSMMHDMFCNVYYFVESTIEIIRIQASLDKQPIFTFTCSSAIFMLCEHQKLCDLSSIK